MLIPRRSAPSALKGLTASLNSAPPTASSINIAPSSPFTSGYLADIRYTLLLFSQVPGVGSGPRGEPPWIAGSSWVSCAVQNTTTGGVNPGLLINSSGEISPKTTGNRPTNTTKRRFFSCAAAGGLIHRQCLFSALIVRYQMMEPESTVGRALGVGSEISGSASLPITDGGHSSVAIAVGPPGGGRHWWLVGQASRMVARAQVEEPVLAQPGAKVPVCVPPLRGGRLRAGTKCASPSAPRSPGLCSLASCWRLPRVRQR